MKRFVVVATMLRGAISPEPLDDANQWRANLADDQPELLQLSEVVRWHNGMTPYADLIINKSPKSDRAPRVSAQLRQQLQGPVLRVNDRDFRASARKKKVA